MMKKKYKDKGWLKFQYVTSNRNPEDIAKECKVDTVTIFRQLKDFNLLKLREAVVKLKEPQTYQNKEWLTNEYVINKRKTIDIAKECNVSASTIRNWLLCFSIKIRGSRMGIWTDKKWLEHQYLDLKKTSIQLAEDSGTTRQTICLWLKIHNIETRHSGWRKQSSPVTGKYADEKWLRHQYLDLRKPQREIAKELGISPSTVSHWLIKFDIPRDPTLRKFKGDGRYRNKEWLRKQFEDKSKLVDKIAEESGVSRATLYNWAKKYNIKREDCRFYPPVITKTGKVIDKDNKEAEAWFYEEYWVKGKTLEHIANENNTSPQTILRWMELFDTPRRNIFDYKRPSSLERQFIQFIEDNNLPFEFVGTDYSKKIDLSKYPDVKWKRYKLLDFIHNTKNIGIELSDKRDIRKLKKLSFKDWDEYEQEVSRALRKADWKVLFVYDEFINNSKKFLVNIKKKI